MSDYVCDQLKEAINLLKEALQSCDREEIARLVEEVAQILKDLYEPIKNDFYYGNLICKDLYVEIRLLRESVIELLIGGQENPCGNCPCKGVSKEECGRPSQGILSVLQDAGGSDDCCNLEEVACLLKEALDNILKIRRLLCTCCSYDSCNLNSCSNDCDDCCDESSCSGGCDSSSCSSCSRSCDSSSSSSCGSSSSCDSCSSSSSSCGSCSSSSSSCDSSSSSCSRC